MSAGQKQAMSLGQIMAAELRQEAISTRKMLERLPADKLTWKPHDKSMSLDRIAGHVVEMLVWTRATLTADELDFAAMDYKPRAYTEASELVADFERNLADALEVLDRTPNETMSENWTLRNGEQVLLTLPKAAVMRTLVIAAPSMELRSTRRSEFPMVCP